MMQTPTHEQRMAPCESMQRDLAANNGQVSKDRWDRWWAELEATLLPSTSGPPKQLQLFGD